MVDVMTRKPLNVSKDEIAGPYIMAPFSQLTELCQLLDRHNIRHSVGENVISFNGGPETAIVNLGRGADATAVQAILDSAR